MLVGDARYGAFHRFIEPDELRFSGIQIADLRLTQAGHQVELKTVWQKTFRRAKVP